MNLHNEDLSDPPVPLILYKELLIQLMHELRLFNGIIKKDCETITMSLSGHKIDRQSLEYHTNELFEQTYLISLLLNKIDYELNPAILTTEIETGSLYGKFKKAAIALRRVTKDYNIKIKTIGHSDALIDLFRVIDILPYLILDNAIKYSPRNGEIVVEFSEEPNCIDIKVSSMGPLLCDSEILRAFDRGVRGKNAALINPRGSGLGLAFVKVISDLHGATVRIDMKDANIKYNEVDYGNFTILLRFPRRSLARTETLT